MNFLEVYWTDVYKVGHKPMLPVGSVLMQSNFTPRSGKHSNCPNNGLIVSFGQQMMVRKMKEDWDTNFFKRPIEEIDQFGQDITDMLMLGEPYDVSHMKDLHRLGYLPIEIRGIEEGNLIPYKIPLSTIVNTKPMNGLIADWLVNYLESINSAESWQAPTSATLSFCLRQLSKKWAKKTDPENIGFTLYQNHDFSMRGLGGKSAIINSGLGFATSSRGSDTLPVIPAARKYYDEKLVCINSVIASEHAIMCSLTGFFIMTKKGTWAKIGEFEVETFRYLLKKFPTGILSLVSDTWDLWRVITEYCFILKEEILARDGKLVIRPDSGDPVDIICGTLSKLELFSMEDCEDEKSFLKYAEDYLHETLCDETPHGEDGGDITMDVVWNNKIYNLTYSPDWNRYDKQYYFIDNYGDKTPTINSVRDLIPSDKGVIELLYDIFGGDKSSTGYIRLNPKIGAIYGDSINYDRAERIYQRLESKGFASTNIVLGVGSYSLQYVTRDTHGMAQKATYIEVEFDGVVEGIEIFKDPITDDGVKKSAKGLMKVYKENGEYKLKDQCTWEEVEADDNELKIIFRDNEFYNKTTLTAVRDRLEVISELTGY